MTASSQLALPLGSAEPYTYHDVHRPGFFSVLVQGPDGSRRQRSHKLEHLPEVLRHLDPTRDTWISQAEFFKPNRRIVNLWRMPLAYVDLDTYHVTELAQRGPEFQLARLLQYCDDIDLPQPSTVVYSGRGLQVKWLFDKPVPAAALPRWQALQDELCRRLQPLGADFKARDASRVLRLVDTTNSKSAERVRVLHQSATPALGGMLLAGGLVGYDFDSLLETVLPLCRRELEQQASDQAKERRLRDEEMAARQARLSRLIPLDGGASATARGKGNTANLRPFIASELAWARLADLRKLVQMRGWAEQGAPAGQRDLMLFLAACFMAQAVVVPRLKEEVVELAKEFVPTWTSSQVQSCVTSVLARAEAAARGKTVELDGRAVDARYRWRNTSLIERLGITPQEERQLATIVSKAESRRRDAERKSAARLLAIESGVALSRQAWLDGHEQRRATARVLRAQGRAWPEVASLAGYPSAAAARMACR